MISPDSDRTPPATLAEMRDVLLSLLSDEGGFMTLMRSGLQGLTDAEYFWEPVEDCWSVRPSAELRTPLPPWKQPGAWGLDISYPEPTPSPFTTIAWRLVHMTGSVGVASATIAGRRRPDGGIDDSEREQPVPPAAAEAIEQWQGAINQLRLLISRATQADLDRHERQWWDEPGSSAPVWQHVVGFGYFEPASHGAEVRLLRDLYRHTLGGTSLRQATAQ